MRLTLMISGTVMLFALALIMFTGNVFADRYVAGDADGSGLVDVDDVVFIIEYIFASGPAPEPIAAGDANCSGAIDIDDVVYLIAYIFSEGPEPCAGTEPSGSLVGMSGCTMFEADLLVTDSLSFMDCIEYEYDGVGVLTMQHINAGFNCCPEIAVNFYVEGTVITIEQIEIIGQCDCLCLFDLDYEIVNLEPGEYTITVIEPYVIEGDDPLEFDVDLSSSASGGYCVYRYHYPWGQEPMR